MSVPLNSDKLSADAASQVAGAGSLLAPGVSQPDLGLGVGPVSGARFLELEAKGEFTGERFFKQRPEEYRMCVALLASGWGVIRVGRFLHCSPNTVMAVRDREGLRIGQEKEELSKVFLEGGSLAADGIRELLAEFLSNPLKRATVKPKDLRDLAVIAGIMVQNGQLLAGEVTERRDVREVQVPAHEDFNRYIERLPSAGSGAGTSLAGGNVGAKEAAGVPGEGSDGVVGAGSAAGTDLLSEGETPTTKEI